MCNYLITEPLFHLRISEKYWICWIFITKLKMLMLLPVDNNLVVRADVPLLRTCCKLVLWTLSWVMHSKYVFRKNIHRGSRGIAGPGGKAGTQYISAARICRFILKVTYFDRRIFYARVFCFKKWPKLASGLFMLINNKKVVLVACFYVFFYLITN